MYSKRRRVASKRSYSKAFASKKKREALKLGSVSRPIKLIAPRLIVELPWATTWKETSTTVYSRKTYRLNSVFDPYQTGTGHQPRAFDQYAALYENYVVHKCSVKIIASNGDFSGSPVVAAICMAPGTALPGIDDIQRADEQKGAGFRLLQPGGNQPVVIKRTYNIADWIGKDDSKKQTAVTADPADPLYLFVITDSADPSNGHTVFYHIVLTYTVEFMDMKEVGIS